MEETCSNGEERLLHNDTEAEVFGWEWAGDSSRWSGGAQKTVEI